MANPGYDCGCQKIVNGVLTGYPCPKIKGTAGDPFNHIGVDALAIHRAGARDAKDCVGSNPPADGKRGAGAYLVEYKQGMHFRNDDHRGTLKLDVIVAYRPGSNFVCDGLHMSEAMAQTILADGIDLLAKRRGNNFIICNHDTGAEQVFDSWTYPGMADFLDRTSDALAAMATS